MEDTFYAVAAPDGGFLGQGLVKIAFKITQAPA